MLGTNMNAHSAATLGPRIGYMPQDIALVNELSIKETIFYFGRIYGMNEDRIRERFKILKDLLELPDSDRMIEKLSGGQKRRVSFACALVHGKYKILLATTKSRRVFFSSLFLHFFFRLLFVIVRGTTNSVRSKKILAEPELVILDEPTVGLDPLLREKYVMMTGLAAATNFSICFRF